MLSLREVEKGLEHFGKPGANRPVMACCNTRGDDHMQEQHN
jgi:hypothetical protein